MGTVVQLMVTCIINSLYPETGEAVVDVLQRAGCDVHFPSEQTCCGQPAFNAGLRAEAQRMAKHTIEVFESEPGVVVVPSGSCTAMIRHGYVELFQDDAHWKERAQHLAERTYEFAEYLVDHLGVVDLDVASTHRIAYHASCHLNRELGIHQQPLALLDHIHGAQRVDLADSDACCGFGGVFSVEQPLLSTAMVEEKISHIEESGADLIVACDAGCITQINGALHRRGKSQCVKHIADILAQRPQT